MSKIVALTVSINYADYLAVTLPRMVQEVEKVYVVTTRSDHETRSLCMKYPSKKVKLLTMDESRLYENGAKFNKSGLVHDGQKIVHAENPDAWILLVDADIVLPHNFADVVNPTESLKDKEALYTLERYDFETPQQLEKRVGSFRYPDYHVAVGYFQLYHDKSRMYPNHSYDCSQCDVIFGELFPKQIKIRGAFVSHLGLGGRNWKGRVTNKWV